MLFGLYLALLRIDSRSITFGGSADKSSPRTAFFISCANADMYPSQYPQLSKSMNSSSYICKSYVDYVLETHLTYGDALSIYFHRIAGHWRVAGSNNYTVVVSRTGVEDSPLSIPRRVVVRNGEPVEEFYTQDTVVEGVTYRAREKAENHGISLDWLWDLAENYWARGAKGAHATFGYEYGYPTAIHSSYGTKCDEVLKAEDYTPLEE